MNNNNSLLQEFNNTIKELITLLSSFSEEKFNQVPVEGSWTAAEVAEHLLKSYSGAPQFLQGPTNKTKRDPAQHVEMLRTVFMNFTTKMKSPDFILPERKDYNITEMISSIKAISRQIDEVVQPLDLNETCTGFSLPTLGELTRFEWINFMTLHTKRHIHQLREIKGKLS